MSSTPSAPAPTPVSILIRSMGRAALLQQALDSVAQQTWPAIDVVVVAAIPNHPPLPEHCGPFPLRLLTTDQPLHRSQAANLALDAARGEYLLFLDDDDGLGPNHVEKLARELDRRMDVQVAYSEVQPVNFERVAEGPPFDLPFDPVRLLAGNWMPLHAVMFRRSLIDQGCRFDPDLDFFEDWDFWLQAARWTGFAHVPGVSAWYRIHESSGIHQTAAFSGPSHVKLYQKWQSRWTGQQLSEIMARVYNQYELAEQAKQLRQEIGALQQRNAALQQQNEALQRQSEALQQRNAALQQQSEALQRHNATLQQQFDALLGSTSWRVTAPLRAVSCMVRSILQLGRPKASRHRPP